MDITWLWIPVITFVVLIAQIYFQVRRMSNPEKMMIPLSDEYRQKLELKIAPYKDWLDSVNLSYLTSFYFGNVSVIVYQQKNNPRFFSFFFHQKMSLGIESYLGDLTILDTGTSGTGGLFPRPGSYLQSLPGISPQEAWRRHIEAESHLSEKFGYDWKPLEKPYTELLTEAVKLRMKYNRSQSFWPIRVLYRFFVTRNLIKNRTIAQQFP